MSERTNENMQGAEGEIPVIALPVRPIEEPVPVTEEAPTTPVEEAIPAEPKLIGTKVITIKTDIYDNGQQSISVNTPDGSSMAENLGMLDICRHILLKDKF